MDISNIVAAPRTIDIKHPFSGALVGLRVTLRPDSSDEVVAAKRKLINERLQNDVKPTAERIEQNAFALLESAISDWEWQGELNFEGAKPELNAVNLRKVLKRLPWVKDQIDIALGNDASFFENSANA